MNEKQVILLYSKDITEYDLIKLEVALDNVFPYAEFLITNKKLESINIFEFFDLATKMGDIAKRLQGETLFEKIVRKVKEIGNRIF